MGWTDYSIYGGDGTQSLHYSFLDYAGIKLSEEEEDTAIIMTYNKTKLSPETKNKFLERLPKVLKKMPKVKFWNEDKAMEWQMLAALLLDIGAKIPKKVKRNAKLATEYLMEDHAADFDYPYRRRKSLRNFISKLDKA